MSTMIIYLTIYLVRYSRKFVYRGIQTFLYVTVGHMNTLTMLRLLHTFIVYYIHRMLRIHLQYYNVSCGTTNSK